MVNKRIAKICELVTHNKTAEIGADHGKITLELLKQKKAEKVYLTDISDKSLQKARDNFKTSGFLSCAEFLVGDGLLVFDKPVKEFEAIIAGMGGKEIISILSNENRVDGISDFILQPQKNVVQLREFLIKNGYKIIVDTMVKDMGKFYNVLKVTKGEDSLSTLELNFGKTNLKEYNKDFAEYIEKQLKMFKDVLQKTATPCKPKKHIDMLEEVCAILKKENKDVK